MHFDRSQHEVIIGRNAIIHVEAANSVDHRAPGIECRMRRHPTTTEGPLTIGRATPGPHHTPAPAGRDEIDIAVNNLISLKRIRDVGENTIVSIAIIRIQKSDCRTGKQPKALVHRVIDARIRLRNHHDLRISVSFDNLQGPIARRTINDDQLLVGMILGKEQFKRLFNRLRRIAADGDDRDQHQPIPTRTPFVRVIGDADRGGGVVLSRPTDGRGTRAQRLAPRAPEGRCSTFGANVTAGDAVSVEGIYLGLDKRCPISRRGLSTGNPKKREESKRQLFPRLARSRERPENKRWSRSSHGRERWSGATQVWISPMRYQAAAGEDHQRASLNRRSCFP